MIQPNTQSGAAVRCLSIDVEEYFHIEAAHGSITCEQWNDWPSRVERNIDLLLELMAKHNRKATFFILGDVVRRTPAIAKKIAAVGHEIASHGTNHDRLHRLNPQSFREDLLTSKQLLEDQTGQRVIGYRAPTFSVVPQTAWAIDVLIECGFEYDSSIFPVVHPWYGVPSAPATPFFVKASEGGASLLEVPPLVWRVAGRNVAVAGGGYFRLLPLWFMQRGIAQSQRDARPAVLYFHPWEFDPDMPRLPLKKFTSRLRTYTGLKSAASKLETIMREPGDWRTIAEAMPVLREQAKTTGEFCLATA